MANPWPIGNMCPSGTHIAYYGKLDTWHCIDSRSKTYKRDQWIRAELIVPGDSLITHIINEDTVLQYSQPQIGVAVVNRFDTTQKPDGKILKKALSPYKAKANQ